MPYSEHTSTENKFQDRQVPQSFDSQPPRNEFHSTCTQEKNIIHFQVLSRALKILRKKKCPLQIYLTCFPQRKNIEEKLPFAFVGSLNKNIHNFSYTNYSR